MSGLEIRLTVDAGQLAEVVREAVREAMSERRAPALGKGYAGVMEALRCGRHKAFDVVASGVVDGALVGRTGRGDSFGVDIERCRSLWREHCQALGRLSKDEIAELRNKQGR